MPSHEFPAPPDLSKLLQFFESPEGKARAIRQSGQKGVARATAPLSRSPSSQSAFSTRLSSKSPNVSISKSKTGKSADKPVAAGRSGKNPVSQSIAASHSSHKYIRDEKGTTPQDWNGSTQLPPAPTKALRHQVLCRTYQPPSPVYMVPSEATGVVDRLTKATISSRSRLKSQRDAKRDEPNVTSGENAANGVPPAPSADSRGRDAIQTLLFYRKEVEKRRRVDSSNLRVDTNNLRD